MNLIVFVFVSVFVVGACGTSLTVPVQSSSNIFDDLTVAENWQGLSMVDTLVCLMGVAPLACGRQPTPQSSIVMLPIHMYPLSSCDNNVSDPADDIVRSGFRALYTVMNTSSFALNESSAAAANVLAGSAIAQQVAAVGALLQNSSTGENFLGVHSKFMMTCLTDFPGINTTLLLHVETIAMMELPQLSSPTHDAVFTYQGSVVAVSDVAPPAAASAECLLNVSQPTSGTTCTQTVPSNVNPLNSLANMTATILPTAQACQTIQVCFSGTTVVVINAGQCHIGAEFSLRLQATYKEDWVCLYL
jgi:hypothetical protein